MSEIKPIPYTRWWAHIASIVEEGEIVLQVLSDDAQLTPMSRKELEGRITIAKQICQWIDWCANHTDEIDAIRRRDRRQTAKAHEEASA